MPAKLHAEELDIDVGLVRRLLEEQFPHWAALPLVPFEAAGAVNVLFRLGDSMAVRLPRLIEWSDGVEHEHDWLPRLAPLVPVPIPELLGKGVPADGYPCPWSIFRWLDGKNPTPGRVAKPVAQDLAGFVLALRRVDTGGAPPGYRGGPLTPWDEPLRSALARLQGEIDVDAAVAAWEQVLAQPEWTGEPVWVHSDLIAGNLLVRDDRLSGVLDFAASGVGDPACDLMPAWSLLAEDTRETFRAAVDVDDATWTRGRGWSLAQALIALPYYRETNPTMAVTARYAIQEVLADS